MKTSGLAFIKLLFTTFLLGSSATTSFLFISASKLCFSSFPPRFKKC